MLSTKRRRLWRHSKKAPFPSPGEGPQKRQTYPHLDLGLPASRENKFLLCKLLSLWYFINPIPRKLIQCWFYNVQEQYLLGEVFCLSGNPHGQWPWNMNFPKRIRERTDPHILTRIFRKVFYLGWWKFRLKWVPGKYLPSGFQPSWNGGKIKNLWREKQTLLKGLIHNESFYTYIEDLTLNIGKGDENIFLCWCESAKESWIKRN